MTRSKNLITSRMDKRGGDVNRLIFGKLAYRRRRIVVHMIGGLKGCHQMGMRSKNFAINFPVLIKIAIIQPCLNFALSDRA